MQPNVSQERRCAPRQRSLLGAALRITPDMSATDCIVRDIHAGGARLLIGDTIPLTDTFELTIGPRRDTKRARLVWRREGAVGVAFVQSRPAGIVPLDLMRALRATRMENDALRQRVADLQHQLDRPDA